MFYPVSSPLWERRRRISSMTKIRKAISRSTGIAIFALATLNVSTASGVDKPVSPPASYVRDSQSGDYVVAADVESDTTTIYRKNNGPERGWTIPGWHRNVLVHEYGQSALILTDNAPLASSDSRSMPVFIFAAKGEELKTITVGDLGNLKLPKTASYFLVYKSLSDAHFGWLVRFPNGQARTISAHDGKINFNPSPRDLYKPGRQGFDHFFKEAREQLENGHCVTYSTFFENSHSRSWRPDARFGTFVGPHYPIPRLPDAYMDGCVYALPDNQITDITVYHRDAGQRQPLDPVYDMPFFRCSRSTLWRDPDRCRERRRQQAQRRDGLESHHLDREPFSRGGNEGKGFGKVLG